MSLANVNIGTTADDGTGDPLRSAFNKINLNFANLAAINGNANVVIYATGNANVAATYNSGVTSVAGRTGTVILGVADVNGAASTGYVNSQISSLSTDIDNFKTWANIYLPNFPYTPGNASNWNDTVSNVAMALDQLAARIKAIESQ